MVALRPARSREEDRHQGKKQQLAHFTCSSRESRRRWVSGASVRKRKHRFLISNDGLHPAAELKNGRRCACQGTSAEYPAFEVLRWRAERHQCWLRPSVATA